MKNWTPEEIKELRKQYKLSQTKFGKLLGISKTYVYYLEKGKRFPSKILKLLLDFREKQLQEKEVRKK